MLMLTAGTQAAQSSVATTTPVRESATAAGSSHSPLISVDGRFVVFISHANNLVTNDDRGLGFDLFRRDRQTGMTTLVSVSTNGWGGLNGDTYSVSLSSNAQVIAFQTDATNLTPLDSNSSTDIYVRDLSSNATLLVSVNVSGTAAGNGRSMNPIVSADGRYVVFESHASDLVTNDFNHTNDVFIRDLALGVTSLVSVNGEGTASPSGASHSPAISADGAVVAFVSHATNLVIGPTNTLGEVYARDLRTGSNRWAVASHRISTWGRDSFGRRVSYRASEPSLSSDGRFVAFKTEGSTVRFDLSRSTNSLSVTYTNGFDLSALLFEDNPRLVGAAGSAPLVLDPAGRYLAYEVKTNNATSSGAILGGVVRVDLETLQTNAFFNGPGGVQGNWVTNIVPVAETLLSTHSGVPWFNWPVGSPSSWFYFLAEVTNLLSVVPRPAFSWQLYALNVTNRQISVLSTNRQGLGPSLTGIQPALSLDGSAIAWDTPDTQLIENDRNGSWDVVLRNLSTGASDVELVSVVGPGLPAQTATGWSGLPAIALSANGRRLVLASTDTSMVETDTNAWQDLFLVDLDRRESQKVSEVSWFANAASQSSATSTASRSSLSADGRYLAFTIENWSRSGIQSAVVWRNVEERTNYVIVTSNFRPDVPVISFNGSMVACAASAGVSGVDQISDGNAREDVLLRVTRRIDNLLPSFPVRNPVVISSRPDRRTTGNGASLNPQFSPDGNWIIFQSDSTDLVAEYTVLSPGAPAGLPNWQLYARRIGCDDIDCATNRVYSPEIYLGPTHLVSHTRAPGVPHDVGLAAGATNAAFSGDSRRVAFETFDGRIYVHELNSRLETTITLEGGQTVTNRFHPPNTWVCTNCGAPSLNDDGSLVAFEERLPSATNILVRNLTTGEAERVSLGVDGTVAGNGRSIRPLLSRDGRFVVFTSWAPNLVADDRNRASDVFVRDRWNGITHCLSRSWGSANPGNGASSQPVLSADGRTVAFQSLASDLIPGDYNDRRDVFVASLAGPDTDGDGMDDELEMAYFDTLERDGREDFDRDGISDRDEIRAGTAPADGQSVLSVVSLGTALVGDAQRGVYRSTLIAWKAAPGRAYQVEYRADANSGGWRTLEGVVVAAGSSASKLHTEYVPPDAARGFYRVKLVD